MESTGIGNGPRYRKNYICPISRTHIFETHFINETSSGFWKNKVCHSIHPNNAVTGGSDIIIKESNKDEKTSYKTELSQATSLYVQTDIFETIVPVVNWSPRHKIRKHNILLGI